MGAPPRDCCTLNTPELELIAGHYLALARVAHSVSEASASYGESLYRTGQQNNDRVIRNDKYVPQSMALLVPQPRRYLAGGRRFKRRYNKLGCIRLRLNKGPI